MVARLGGLIALLRKALVEVVVAPVELASLAREVELGDYLGGVCIGCRQ